MAIFSPNVPLTCITMSDPNIEQDHLSSTRYISAISTRVDFKLYTDTLTILTNRSIQKFPTKGPLKGRWNLGTCHVGWRTAGGGWNGMMNWCHPFPWHPALTTVGMYNANPIPLILISNVYISIPQKVPCSFSQCKVLVKWIDRTMV